MAGGSTIQLLILRDPLPVSSPKPQSSAIGVSAPLVIALGAVCGWLVTTIVPGIGPLDAGDFATASRTLGVPHATGFPLEVMLGHAATWLPWSSAAARVGLVSALSTGAAIACGGWWLCRATPSRLAGAAAIATGAIAVAGADTLRLHVAVPEVYALQLAIVVACIAVAAEAQRTRDARWAVMLALLAGLGVANHAVGRLAVPVLMVAAWFSTPPDTRRRAALLGLVVGTLAVGAYAYLFAAAGREPLHNWGDPSSPMRWWRHITGAQIREAFADQMSPSPASMRLYGHVLNDQVSNALGAGAIVGAAGVGLAAIRGRPGARVATALVLIDIGYAIAINPMGLRDGQNGQVTIFVLALGCGLLAIELATFAGRALPSPGTRTLTQSVAVAAVAGALATAGSDTHERTGRDWSTEDVALAALLEPPPRALITTATDSQTAATLYTAVALDARPDAAVFGRHVLSSGESAAWTLPRQPFVVVPPETLRRWVDEGNGPVGPRAAELLSLHVGQRPIRWEVAMTTDDLPQGLPFEHRWPYGRPIVPGTPGDECTPGERSYCLNPPFPARAENARDAGGAAGLFARRWLASQWAWRGAREVRSARCDRAMPWFDGAAQLAPEISNHHTNRGVCLAQLGDTVAALAAARQALAIDPSAAAPRRNAIRYARLLGDTALADALEADAPAAAQPR